MDKNQSLAANSYDEEQARLERQAENRRREQLARTRESNDKASRPDVNSRTAFAAVAIVLVLVIAALLTVFIIVVSKEDSNDVRAIDPNLTVTATPSTDAAPTEAPTERIDTRPTTNPTEQPQHRAFQNRQELVAAIDAYY